MYLGHLLAEGRLQVTIENKTYLEKTNMIQFRLIQTNRRIHV